jgi:glycerophosphoryl diester phosphodiesterase
VVHHDAAPAGGQAFATAEFREVRERWGWIPTLTEALDACVGMLVDVEVKNLPWEPDFDRDERTAHDVAALLASRGDRDRVLVSSFHLPTIDRIREVRPQLHTGFLLVAGMDLLEASDLAAARGHTAVHPDVRAVGGPGSAAFVEDAHRNGLDVNVWTVNEPSDMARLTALGIDALISDVPDVARRVVDQPGNTTDNASGT